MENFEEIEVEPCGIPDSVLAPGTEAGKASLAGRKNLNQFAIHSSAIRQVHFRGCNQSFVWSIAFGLENPVLLFL